MNNDGLSPLAKRLITETIRQKASPNRFLDPKFPAQNAFVLDNSRFIAAQCSRRAGKSNGLAVRFLRTMEKHPGAMPMYLSLTRESAENIMWPALQEQDEKFKIGCTFTTSDLTMQHPNGSRLKLYGADMKNFIRRLRGIKTPGVGIDEAQDFGPHLKSLVDDVLTPAMTDYQDSWLALTGTPGPVPVGYFYEVTQLKKYGYSHHAWTLLDNPYLPNAREFIEELKRKRAWGEDNPTLLREWRNQWVLDVESLLVRYHEELNHNDVLPSHDWVYILGVDLGINDADALAVLAWSESCPDVYLVEEVITRGQGVTELAHQIQALMERYDISKFPTDEGALGKKIAEELRRRFHIPLQAADKHRKMENVTLLNDWLRLGRFKAKRTSRFADDSKRVQIDWERTTPDRIVVKKGYHSDIIDAVLYAFKESPAFTYQKPVLKPAYGTPAWAEAEVDAMEEAAMEHFSSLESGYGDEI
jgi:hypothetical protein